MIYNRGFRDQPRDAVFCYGGWDQDLPPGIQYGPIIRDIYIVECCTGGKGAVVINGTCFPVKEGDCYLLCPGDTIIHQADWVDPRTGVWCAIDGMEVAAAFTRAGITAQSPFAAPESFQGILRETAALVNCAADTDDGARLRQRAHIYGILSELLRPITPAPSGNASIEQALKMMEVCYHEEVSVTRMAQAAGLERCYFSTLFKQTTGQSPHRYLASLRIKKACALLSSTSFPVATIAAAVGIPPENFARLFKKEIGLTPLIYRKKQRQQAHNS